MKPKLKVNSSSHKVRAVLFDLDDTLLDHQHCNRVALMAVRQNHRCFGAKSVSEIERENLRLLNEFHDKFLRGVYTLDEARRERFRRLFRFCGEEVSSDDVILSAVGCFRRAYLSVRRPVPGALALLRELKPRVKIGVVTNNLVSEQQDKLKVCGLEPFVDAVAISEEVGFIKPQPEIFRVALERLDCACEEAVMVGDLWEVDILGARAAGIRPVWLNRYETPCPEEGVAAEITALEPLDEVLRLIFNHEETAAGRSDEMQNF